MAEREEIGNEISKEKKIIKTLREKKTKKKSRKHD
jgi:hypothetical protein